MKLKNLVTGTVAVMALGTSGLAVAAIDGSPHDLGGTNAADNGEVCVYCHTPHGADTAVTESAPLWNKALPAGTAYTRYSTTGSATLDGQETTEIGSVSLACLSCHDGTQARDSVINAPGSGGYTAGGAVMGGGTGTTIGNPPVRNLEQDLSDDHPIGIEYGGGSCTNMTVGVGTVTPCTPDAVTGDPDFQVVKGTILNGVNQYWVDVAGGTSNSGATVTGQADVRQKTDMILYARAFGGQTGPSVECGSCHDPHEGQANGNDVSFLRISNVNSQVCLACHIK
jgi:hypothetical protein